MIPVIGFGQISFFDLKKDRHILLATAGRIKVNTEHFDNVKYDAEEGWITFEMSGNKGIDYTELEKIKDELAKDGLKVEIHVKEYMECDGTGFYYSTAEVPDISGEAK